MKSSLTPSFGDNLLAALDKAARGHATPCYVTDIATLERQAEELESAFPDPWIRQYSLKANDVPALVARLWRRGWGANVVSLGEWRLARAAGVPNKAVSLEGIGKTTAEFSALAEAVRTGDPIRWISVESVDELEELARTCCEALRGIGPPDVLLRLNPQVAPETLAGLAVGKPSSKFGMTHSELGAAARHDSFADGTLRLRGVHVHVGSQLNGVDAWVEGATSALQALAELRETAVGRSADTLDVGGGFPVSVAGGPAPIDFADALTAAVARSGHPLPARVAVEPGRYLVAEAGWLVATVLHARERSGRQQLVLDAGMTELMRPSLYAATHPVVALAPAGEPGSLRETDVEGPICESADSLGRHLLPNLRRGDRVALANAGAYGSSMSSRYNGRGQPAELFLEPDGSVVVGRPAESVFAHLVPIR
jgi:diaminopimelate decarboxylase